MNFDHNPRMSGRKAQPAMIDDELFATPKKMPPKNHYKGAKVVRLGQTEQAMLKGPAADSLSPLKPSAGVSTRAQNTLGMFVTLQMLYTAVIVILVAMQTNTISLSVGDVVYLMVVQNVLTLLVFGMHTKVLNRSDADEQATGKSAFLRVIRNDRRTMLFFIATVISCAATIDIVYIASIAPSMNTKADSFRETGKNNFVHRAIDLFETLVFALAFPLLLTLIAEGHWVCKSQQHRQVETLHEQDDEDDDDNDERRTPRSIRTIG